MSGAPPSDTKESTSRTAISALQAEVNERKTVLDGYRYNASKRVAVQACLDV
jgi:hypothetical protein